jgi:hypothetical protein
LMTVLKTVKTEKAKCVVFSNFVIVCAGDRRGGGLLEKMISFFFMMTEHSCSAKMRKVLQPSFQVVLSIKSLESHAPRDVLQQGLCQPGETGRMSEIRLEGKAVDLSLGESTSCYHVQTPLSWSHGIQFALEFLKLH